MSAISTNDPILKIEELQTKFDLGIVSNSLIKLLGSYLEARIVQQLHYWTVQEYGQIINGLRWIYKPAREWLSEALIGFTSWQLRSAIAALVEKGILLREHLFKEHHGNNFAPKNRTYYYSLNYEGLEEFAQKYESTETTENVRFVSNTKQFCDSSEKQFCDSPQNNTKNTSIENSSKDKSHPTLPSVCEISGADNQDQQSFSKSELDSLKAEESKKVDSVTSKAVEKDISSAQVEEKVNQNKDTVQESVQVENVQEPVRATNGSRYPLGQALEATSKDAPSQVEKAVSKPKRSKTPGGARSHGSETSPGSHLKGTKPKRKDKAPWKDEGQFKRFYRALVQALPQVANAHSPQGLAQTIIRQLRSGIPHSYWDDFIAGTPIGTSTMPEWEVEPGVPYPMFIEFLTEKIKRGDNTQSDEQTRNEVFRILNKPRQAKAFWGQFKRSLVNVSERVERDLSLGVSNPNTPVWTRERIEPSIEEAAAAGEKIMAVNGNVLPAIESASNPQLESKGFSPVSQSPSPPVPQSSTDPWTEDDKPQLSMREMLAARGVKGFCKPMPKVSQAEVEAEERKQQKPKTNISQMSLAEINEYLADPVLRKQIMPQLMHSDYELITNEYGDIIGVRRPSSS